MTARRRLLTGVGVVAGTLMLAGAAWAQLPSGAKLPTAEERVSAQLPAPKPHWVYVVEPVFPHLIASNVWILDGDSEEMLGVIDGGYTANFAMAPDEKELYLAETFWSRGSRGQRTDVVTWYDPRTLEPQGEVELPRGRFLVVTKKYDADVTTDGRYLVSYNMAPATSVSVVDLETRTYVTDIETPGCALMYVMGPNRFAMMCADGSFLTVDFDADGGAEMKRGDPFFDVENDPVFEHPAFSKRAGRAFFVSYEGLVYPVDFSGPTPRVGESWSLVNGAEKGTWWPGGWQVATYHPETHQLFVLMHRGRKWTHKNLGEEIWVFDTRQQKRTARMQVENAALSIQVTQDAQPLLFAIEYGEAPGVEIFDARSHTHQGEIHEIGLSPYLLHVTGE